MKLSPANVLATVVVLSSAVSAFTIKAGDKIPAVDLHFGFPPKMVNVAQYVGGREVVIVGLPGAFTPTCSSRQVPGYLEHQEALKDLGVDEVLVYCVNDGAVMDGWARDQKIEGSMVTFMGDPTGEFTKACGMEMNPHHPGPHSKGLLGRCKRWAMYVQKNIVRYVAVSEGPDDPSGDDDPSATLAPALIEAIRVMQPVGASS